MKHEKGLIAQMLPRGSMKKIALKLNISQSAVSLAIRGGLVGHPAVREALRIAQESGALEAAQTLASLSPVQ